MANWKTRTTKRAEAANTDVMEDEPKQESRVGVPIEGEAPPPPEPEPAPLTPSPEPPVLPEWKDTDQPKVEEKDKTVGDWIVQGVRAICDEHKLTSLKAWRDVAGNVQVEYVEDSRAMYALRKK